MIDTKTVILEILADVAPDADPSTLAPGADLRDGLDLDSVDFLGVLVAVGERLGVEVPERDYAEVRSLDALVAYVDQRRAPG
jgi:acyl carrier protein